MNDNNHHSASEYWRGRRRNECTAAGWKIKRERDREGENEIRRERETEIKRERVKGRGRYSDI